MNNTRHFGYACLALLVLMQSSAEWCARQALADGYGSISGQFVIDGDVPEATPIIRKGDPTAKDSKCCAANDLFPDDLVINPKTKGIRHIFIYTRRASEIHPDLKESQEKIVVFDQKNCRFDPHTLLVRTDQTVVLKSGDPIGHNTHWIPIRNQAFNVLIAPNTRDGQAVDSSSTKMGEFLPMPVKCDIHSWMKAYWLVLDHPYMAITDEHGKFKIEKVPVGDHDFTVWHERIGYLDTKKDDKGDFRWNVQRDGVNWVGRKCVISVKADQTTDFGKIKVPAARFEED